MRGNPGRRLRRESAIKRMEESISAHKAGSELTKRVLEDKKLSKTSEEIEKIRKKKIERLELCLENTKRNLNK